MPPRHPRTLAVMASVALSACASPDPAPSDLGAMQLAAATEVVASIASNRGPIVVVCVGYASDRGPLRLPNVEVASPIIRSMDGCVERDGRLVSADGDGQAISVSVGDPEPRDDLRAEVSVLTSTGAIDLAAYTCTVRHRDGAWRSEGCTLDAIS